MTGDPVITCNAIGYWMASQDEIDEGDLVEVVAVSDGRPQVVKARGPGGA